MSDRVSERWANGDVALNAWATFSSVAGTEALAGAGFDAVTIDLQHGEATLGTAAELLGAIERGGAVPFARLPWNDPAAAMRALDLGARGLICPMVGSAAEAAAFVRACRYPPAGERSYGPLRGAFGTGREHATTANEAVLAFAQIETSVGLADVEAICATPGLDGLYVGPADLSLALGRPGFADLADPVLLRALERIVAAARSAGVVAGIHAPSIDRAVEMAGRGFAFVGAAGDAELLRAGAIESLERVRSASPDSGS